MRIALVISSLGAGGAERVMVAMANHWAAHGRAVTLLTFAPPGTRPYYALDPRVTLRQLDVVTGSRRLRTMLAEPAAHIRAAPRDPCHRAGRGDLLPRQDQHHHGPGDAGLGVGVIVSERNNPERQPVNPAWRWLRQRLYGVADRLVTPSQGVLASLPAAVRGRGRVIPNPVDLPRAAPRRTDSRTLVAVGRLDEQKGFDLLLPAFARIAGKHPEWRLVIWGEGTERPCSRPCASAWDWPIGCSCPA